MAPQKSMSNINENISNDNSNESGSFVDIGAVDSDTNNLPDDSSSFENTSTSFFRSINAATSARLKSKRESSTANNETSYVNLRHSTMSSINSLGDSSGGSLVIAQSSPSITRTATTIPEETNPKKAHEADSPNKEILQALLKRKQMLMKINKLLENQLTGSEKNKSDKQLDLTKNEISILQILLEAKSGALNTNTSNDTHSNWLIMNEEDQKFCVLPLYNAKNVRQMLLDKFSPFLRFKDKKIKLIKEANERIISFKLCGIILELNCEIVVDNSASKLKQFKITKYSRGSVDKSSKRGLNSLFDKYFDIYESGELDLTSIVLFDANEDLIQANTTANSKSNINQHLSQQKRVSLLNFDNNSAYTLIMKPDHNITCFLYSLNSFVSQVARRTFIIVHIVRRLSNHNNLIIENGAYIQRNLQNCLDSLNDLYPAENVDDSGSESTSLLSVVDKFWRRARVPENVGFDEYLQRIYSEYPSRSFRYYKLVIMFAVHFLHDLSSLKIRKKGSKGYQLAMHWDINFNFVASGFDAAPEASLLDDDETSVKFCEPSSILKVFVDNNGSQNGQDSQTYKLLNDTLIKLVARKGMVDGACMFVENLFNIFK